MDKSSEIFSFLLCFAMFVYAQLCSFATLVCYLRTERIVRNEFVFFSVSVGKWFNCVQFLYFSTACTYANKFFRTDILLCVGSRGSLKLILRITYEEDRNKIIGPLKMLGIIKIGLLINYKYLARKENSFSSKINAKETFLSIKRKFVLRRPSVKYVHF